MTFSLALSKRIEFLEEAKEQWAHDEPKDPLQPSPTEAKPTEPSKPIVPVTQPPKKNVIANAADKLMGWFNNIFGGRKSNSM